ncbi:unnamed protein product [Callosobruchus maculatus]|uniref:Uncharacterized protein n=1 Tax=Callosobruchus maculatus TaxID=64391 RepID=A0A653C887_CALMS|nr:unnamed protein product [Callosobruchus maculatus]
MGKHKRKERSRSRSRSLSRECRDLRRKIARLERERSQFSKKNTRRSRSRSRRESSNSDMSNRRARSRCRERGGRSPSETGSRRQHSDRRLNRESRSPSVAISLYSRGRASCTTAHDSRSMSHCSTGDYNRVTPGPAQDQPSACLTKNESDGGDSPVLILTDDTGLPDETKSMLGPDPGAIKKPGFKLHSAVEAIWSHILPLGLPKEEVNGFSEKYQIPENCKLLSPPKINPEIEAGMNTLYTTRDQTHANYQAILAQSLSALGLALNATLEDEANIPRQTKEKILVPMADAGRILCNLFNLISHKRRQLITPMMSKQIKNLVEKVPPGEYLFEANLGEKIQALKALEKAGKEIRPVHASPLPLRAQPYVPTNAEKTRGGGSKPSPSTQGNRRRPFHHKGGMRTQKGRPSTNKPALQRRR